jgi:hypothetical protein
MGIVRASVSTWPGLSLSSGTQRLATGRAKLDGSAGVADEAQPIEENIKAERLAQLRHFNKRASEEAALRAGIYVKADDVKQQFGAVAARLMTSFESAFMPMANAVVASKAQTPNDVLRAMRAAWLEARAQAAKAQGEAALAIPSMVESGADAIS